MSGQSGDWTTYLLEALGVVVRLLLLFGPPSIFVWRLYSGISAHSVCLSGQRISRVADNSTEYYFGLQNNEDEALTGQHVVAIRINDPNGKFSREKPPRVYAGCNDVRAELAWDLKSWSMVFDELPGYETWTIKCSMNALARNVSLKIEAANQERLQLTTPRLSHSELSLDASQTSAFVGRRTTPELWWSLIATTVAIGGYLAATYVSSRSYLATGQGLRWGDLVGAASVLAFGTFVSWATRRSAPSITQGYWQQAEEIVMVQTETTAAHGAD